ncbi:MULTISPECIES: hypothetical protein [Kitasatospora]|uniref:hypothetical protein n=1 Tax=Kitasatospora TaxID=2063 RepID=UPI000C713A5F|nr:hypothetical protein [Kitasatospora sp. GP30]MDH6143542.1 hypothetical protein [Kitasatospora sp. GP30]
MDADRIVRVRYFDRQFLRPQDFTDEQAYHVAMRRRHNVAGHSWGILHGLDLTADGGPLAVQPGLAVDGYGREVVVIERMTVPPLPPAPLTGEIAYDIWLIYDRAGSDTAPTGYGACGSEATAYYRWLELPRLLITAADDAVDANHPPQVPPGDLEFGPERTAPEETMPWPVLLGRVRRTTGSGLAIDRSGRRYAGLVAASVAHPRGDARIDLGAAADTDPTRFAVRADSHPDPLFDIAATGTATVHGNLAVNGELRIEQGALEFPVQAAQPTPPTTEAAAPVDAAQPWQVYGAQSGTQRELRVELPSGAANALVIGTWSADKATFTPCLTVRGDNTVTVHGNLTVQGNLSAPATAALAPSAAVQSLATGALLSGIGGAAGVAARLYRPQGTTASASVVATALAADPELLQQVAAQLKQGYGATAGTLAQHLTGEG